MKKKISLIWPGIALGLCLASGCGSSPAGTVYLMGDAKLKLEIGEKEQVKEAEGLNRQAESVLESYEGKGIGVKEAAVGYISQMAASAVSGSSVEVSVVSGDQVWAEAVSEELDQALSELREELQIELLVQTAEELNDSHILEQLTSTAESGEEETPAAETMEVQPSEEETEETEATEAEETEASEGETEEEEPAAAEEPVAAEEPAAAEEPVAAEEPAAAEESAVPAAQTEAARETERAAVQTQPESSAAVEIPETEPPAAAQSGETTSGESLPESSAGEESSASVPDGPGALIGESREQM